MGDNKKRETNPAIEMIRLIQQDLLERVHRGELDYERDVKILKNHLNLATEVHNQALMAQIETLLGMANHEVGNYEVATKHWQSAFTLYSALDDLVGMSTVQNLLGELAFHLGNYTESLEFFNKSRQLAEDGGNLELIMRVEGNLGSLWLTMREFLKARICFSIVVAVTEYETWQHIQSLALAKRGLAEVFLETGNFNAAWQEANDAETLAKGRGLKSILALVYFTKAHIAAKDPDNQSEEAHYERLGQATLRDYGNQLVMAHTLFEEARHLQHRGEIERAVDLALMARDAFIRSNVDRSVQAVEAFLMAIHNPLAP